MYSSLWLYRRFIIVSAWADLRHRFSGSLAGYLWNILLPLVQIAVFAVIFSVLLAYRSPVQGDGKFGFVVFLCAGLLPWNSFAETVVRASGGFVGNAGFLKKLPIPEQVFIAKEVCVGFFSFAFAVSVFLVFMLLTGTHPSLAWIQIVPLTLLLLGFAYGIGMCLACLNVFYRDIQPLTNVLMLLWMWVTPVVYPETAFSGSQHSWMYTVFRLNPAYHFIAGFREALHAGTWITGQRWMVCLGIAVVANLVAWPLLRTLRSEIRDTL